MLFTRRRSLGDEQARPLATPVESEFELTTVFSSLSPSFDRSDHRNEAPIRPAWKRSLFHLLEDPSSSPAAFLVYILTTSLILTSALVTIFETVPYFHSISPSVWFGIETSLVALFTIEYIARTIAWSATWHSYLGWALSFFGIVDLVAILPFYIEILLEVDTSAIFRFSILRTFRLLRMFRAFRNNNTILLTIEVMYLAFRRSQHALLALGFFVVMFLTIFSTLLYFAERGTWDPILDTFIDVDGDPSQFASIPAAAWFVLVTITTVGYGEITPRSFLGRLITVPLLVFGLLLIALPSFVLGREFSIVWEKMGGQKHTDDLIPVQERQEVPSDTPHSVPQTNVLKQIADLQSIMKEQARAIQELTALVGTLARDRSEESRLMGTSASL